MAICADQGDSRPICYWRFDRRDPAKRTHRRLAPACVSGRNSQVGTRNPAVNSPSAVIAEDESLVGAELRRLLMNAWPDLIIREQVTDGLAAVAALDRHHPDILFLDIEMPGLNGLEVARRVSGQTQVVFI